MGPQAHSAVFCKLCLFEMSLWFQKQKFHFETFNFSFVNVDSSTREKITNYYYYVVWDERLVYIVTNLSVLKIGRFDRDRTATIAWRTQPPLQAHKTMPLCTCRIKRPNWIYIQRLRLLQLPHIFGVFFFKKKKILLFYDSPSRRPIESFASPPRILLPLYTPLLWSLFTAISPLRFFFLGE